MVADRVVLVVRTADGFGLVRLPQIDEAGHVLVDVEPVGARRSGGDQFQRDRVALDVLGPEGARVHLPPAFEGVGLAALGIGNDQVVPGAQLEAGEMNGDVGSPGMGKLVRPNACGLAVGDPGIIQWRLNHHGDVLTGLHLPPSRGQPASQYHRHNQRKPNPEAWCCTHRSVLRDDLVPIPPGAGRLATVPADCQTAASLNSFKN